MSAPAEERPIPRAALVRERGAGWAWLIPALALALAAFAGWRAWRDRGVRVTVLATEGHGLAPGDPVRFRGIDVGHIERIELEPGLERVQFHLQLDRSARELARRGTRFWVVRPHLSLEGAEGLETIVGARYLAVFPGHPAGDPEQRFIALEEPPLAETPHPNGITVWVDSPERHGISPGAPIDYRGVRVGTVLDVRLAADGTSVEMQAYVRPAYRTLVRAGTRFYKRGGMKVDAGLFSGVEIEFESLRTLLVGGVSLATPSDPGPEVEAGHRFPLALEPEASWSEWKPPLAIQHESEGVGRAAGKVGAMPRPPLHRAEFEWRRQGIFRRTETRRAWLVRVAAGLLGPAEAIAPPGDARKDSLQWKLDGETRPAPTFLKTPDGRLALAPASDGGNAGGPLLPLAREGAAGDCWVFGDPAKEPAALSGARLKPVEGGFEVDGGPGLDEQWNGAAVVRVEDGTLLGVLCVREGVRDVSVFVARPSAAWW